MKQKELEEDGSVGMTGGKVGSTVPFMLHPPPFDCAMAIATPRAFILH
jgi:hypothetical protein